ncbi:MAG: MerR family DNA-binding transcriptional regulator [Nitrospirae bacterium]|nr:MerR family DNA-binding transcriptional regulator [Candidatus Manganitrophaceae bacterium]
MKTLSIGQAAKEADVNVQTLRYYEKRGLIPAPAKGIRDAPLLNLQHRSKRRVKRGIAHQGDATGKEPGRNGDDPFDQVIPYREIGQPQRSALKC